MYINDCDRLASVVLERLDEKAEIIRRRDEWVWRTYGIVDLSSIVARHMPFLVNKPNTVFAMLARQIPGICVEDICATLMCDRLGFEPVAMSFERDVFIASNHDKLARVKIPWASLSRKGNIMVEYEHIARLDVNSLAGMPLGRIEVSSGGNLTGYHQGLRTALFGERGYVPDISAMWNEVFLAAKNKPEFAYGIIAGKEDKLRVGQALIEGPMAHELRPPSGWYYPIYLSLFLTGEMVLLETYDNPDGGVPEAKKLFERAMKEVENGVGYLPIVVEIPPLTRDLLQCKRVLVERPELLHTLPVSEIRTENTFDLMNEIARLVHALR